MSKRRVIISPGEKERIKIEEKRRIITSWWTEFEKSKHYRKLQAHVKNMSCFAVYTTKEYLFCSTNRDCYSIKGGDVKEFFFKTAPDYITVDEPNVFIEACIQWLLWLCRQPQYIANAKEIEKLLNRLKCDAIRSMENAEGTASKCLVLQALSAGIDPENNDDILQYFSEDDPSGVDYYEEFLLPPHPIYNKGRMLYIFEWPPNKGIGEIDD